jgi:hypothetical protein
MAHNTGNPIGSTSPKDLSDNARNLDLLVLGSNYSYPDRKGVPRKSWAGMEGEHGADQVRREAEFDADQTRRESEFDADQARHESEFDADQGNRVTQFNTFMSASGYEPPIAYAAGILLDRTTKTVSYLGNEYRAKSAFIPFTTTNWAADEAKLKLIGDDSLRQAIADIINPDNGSGLMGHVRRKPTTAATTVGQILSLNAISVWEKQFVDLIVTKPDVNDPRTWEWAPAINAALLYAFNNGYSAVKLADGTYTITQTGLAMQPGVDLIGSGRSTIIKLVGTAGGNAEMTSIGDYGFDIRNLSINHTSPAESNTPFALRGGTHDVTIDNCWVTTNGQAMTVGSSSDAVTPKNITVSNCFFDCYRGCRGRTGLDNAVDDRNILFVNNHMVQRNAAGDIGIEMWIAGATLEDNVVVNPFNTGGSSAFVGSSNNFKCVNNSGYGFNIGVEWGLFGAAPVGCKIDGNYLRGCAIGISVSSVSKSCDVTISRNTVVFDDAIRTDYTKAISFKAPYVTLLNNNIIHCNGENYELDITDVNSRKYIAYHGDQNPKDIKIIGGVVVNFATGAQVSATSGYNTYIGVSFVNVNSASVQSGGTPEERFIGCSFRNHGAVFNNKVVSFRGCTFVNDPTFFAYNKGFVQSTSTIANTVVKTADCSFIGVLPEAFLSDASYPFAGSGAGRPKIHIADGIYIVPNVSLWADVKAVFTAASIAIPYNTTIQTWGTNKTFIKRYAAAAAVIADGTDRIENY